MCGGPKQRNQTAEAPGLAESITLLLRRGPSTSTRRGRTSC
jgi:hypothetical protein